MGSDHFDRVQRLLIFGDDRTEGQYLGHMKFGQECTE